MSGPPPHKGEGDAVGGSAQALKARGLSQKTCQKYKIYRDGDYLRHYYYSATGALLGCKVKTKDKQFSMKEIPMIFLRPAFIPTTENGLSSPKESRRSLCFEACWRPMVSLPSGAASAKKAIKANLELLQGYEDIVLFFDNDEPGRKAAEDCAGVLPPGKVHCPSRRLQDAQRFKEGDTKAVSRAIYDAKPYRPDGIIEARSLLELVTTPLPPNDCDYDPDRRCYRTRYGELVAITAGSGIASPHSAGSLQLHFYKKVDGSLLGS